MDALLNRLRGDKVIWMLTILLCLISMLAVYSSFSTLVYEKGSFIKPFFKHLFMIGAGFFVMFQFHKIKPIYFSKISTVFIWLAIFLLFFTLLFGQNINDAKRWIKVPFVELTFQTSDFAKIVLIVYTARLLHQKRLLFHDFRKGVLPVVWPVVLVCGLILPEDLSTAAILGLVCFMMMVIAGVPWRHLIKLVGAGLVAILIIYTLGESFPDVLHRFNTWSSRINGFFVENSEPNFQIEHSLYAIHEGGFLPSGPGTGSSRNFMPAAYCDTIYAFIIQEYGSILGGTLLIFAYIILLFRSFKIGTKSKKEFSKMTAIGLSLILVVQAFINMAVAVNLLPTTGQPLPLISYGGTSMVFTCMALGIILSISRFVYGEEESSDSRASQSTGSNSLKTQTSDA